MLIKGMVSEDFVNYKKPSMVILTPNCDWKCGKELCQNSPLAQTPAREVDNKVLIDMYVNNDISKALVFSGLEPFFNFNDMIEFIHDFRAVSNDLVIIYTGYDKDEIDLELSTLIKAFPEIIVKFGRYIPGQQCHFDEVLGVCLASDNQYAEKIS